ncbi:MAG TPA: methyltransferase [Candidatus Binatia bacterium]|nr:methyltransferase [Candidatus Binatia bacterium]
MTSTGRVRAAVNVGVAALFALLCAAHWAAGRETGAWERVVPIMVQEALVVGLVFARRPSRDTSPRVADWALGVAGTVLPLLLRPAPQPGPLARLGDPIQIAGVLLAVVAIGSLGRSFGVVPANRGVKTLGPYGVVRHPAYAAYVLSGVGYVLSQPTPANAAIVVATLLVMDLRATAEERLLSRDAAYDAYRRRVRWRFVVGVR